MNAALWLIMFRGGPEATEINQSDAYQVAQSEWLPIGAVEWQALEIGAAVSQSIPVGSHEYEVGR